MDWCCMVSIVYAANDQEGRKSLWESVAHLTQDTMPWVMMGDFNVVYFPNECVGGSDNWPSQINAYVNMD